jgi:uncharacterized protein YicC (UPF0701 family)
MSEDDISYMVKKILTFPIEKQDSIIEIIKTNLEKNIQDFVNDKSENGRASLNKILQDSSDNDKHIIEEVDALSIYRSSIEDTLKKLINSIHESRRDNKSTTSE